MKHKEKDQSHGTKDSREKQITKSDPIDFRYWTYQ